MINRFIPSSRYISSVKKIFEGEIIKNLPKNSSFNTARKACFNSRSLQKLLYSRGIKKPYEISAGTSDIDAYKGFLNQLCFDIQKNRYYKNYSIPRGTLESLDALALLENLKLDSAGSYTYRDFCFTEGATGAITMIFEFIKSNFPDCEILIPSPVYYVYRYAAQSLNLSYKEVVSVQSKNRTSSFISINSVIAQVTSRTKLIVLVNPINPSGEIYPEDQLEELLRFVKKKNILILADELFEELVFDEADYTPIGKVAARVGALENIVVVKGYSKTKNLPGLRIGYLFSKNTQLVDTCDKLSEFRQCFPVAANFTGLIVLDCFLQSVKLENIRNNNIGDQNKLLRKIKKEFNFTEAIGNRSINSLMREFTNYKNYIDSLLRSYSQLYDRSMSLLDKDVISYAPKQSSFNTLVKLKDLEGVNLFDFTLNLYLATGVEIELGPCFGLGQRLWESDTKLGFWMRITFAREKSILTEGIKKFLEFKSTYITYPEKFISTKLHFS